ncbi:protein phosphatase 2C [Histomonas meleagridis]|uniref:protein phosphatase 2C n=1 Tax=Histomonas meleagridis TaxID=135588 RepID=UPI0035596A73|nr:protein phosphatase 2C [Histomonas meleagridis]KAH0806766.1 protein phosphatase 2C [Histomonas meleagridis]
MGLTKLQTISLQDNFTNKIPDQVFEALISYTSLTQINLDDNHLTEIPVELEKVENLETLYIRSNDINVLKKSNFKKLSLLDLSCNSIQSVQSIPECVTFLNLSFNLINQLTFSSQILQRLNLAGNNLTELPQGVVFPSLRSLVIPYNKIIDITNIKEFAPNLDLLNASYNLIDKFPELPENITSVYLDNNKLTTIPPLDKYSKLSLLYLFKNEITKIPKLPTTLRDFEIFGNKITEVEAQSSEFSMRSVTLNDNSFTDIPHFANNIYIYSISSNSITQLNVSNLCNTICKLDISSNGIKEVPSDIFLLPNLTQLFMHNNSITSIPDEFSNSKIEYLSISNNPINELPKAPGTLTILYAACCEFNEFPDEILAETKISTLNLSNNKIKSIKLLPTLEKLHMSCNEITNIPELPEKINVIDFSHNQISSFELKGTHNSLTEIDLSHNKLTNFTISERYPLLTILKIAYNLELSSLDLTNIPYLDFLDINHTKIKLTKEELERPFTEVVVNKIENVTTPSTKYFDCVNVGYAEMKGSRSEMEDSLIIRQIKEPNIEIYAVIDGHGGTDTARYVAFQLPKIIINGLKDGKLSNISEKVKNSIETTVKHLKERKFRDGATMALVVKHGNTIVCANIGDSRALLIEEDGKAEHLLHDHKPYLRDEIERIRTEKGDVRDNRTDGILAISRSIRDFEVRGVTAEPDIVQIEIGENVNRLVLACDGVFDVMSVEEVGMIVESEEDPSLAAYKVRNAAFAKNSYDNISVIVVDLKP